MSLPSQRAPFSPQPVLLGSHMLSSLPSLTSRAGTSPQAATTTKPRGMRIDGVEYRPAARLRESSRLDRFCRGVKPGCTFLVARSDEPVAKLLPRAVQPHPNRIRSQLEHLGELRDLEIF